MKQIIFSKPFQFVIIGAIIGILGVMPMVANLITQVLAANNKPLPFPMPVVLVIQFFQSCVIVTSLALIGFWLSEKIQHLPLYRQFGLYFIFVIFGIYLTNSCYNSKQQLPTKNKATAAIDSFVICDKQELALQNGYVPACHYYFEGGRLAMFNYIRQNYIVPNNVVGQNGYLMIRFVINCNGEAGKFNLVETDTHYKAFEFDPSISIQLLEIMQKIKNWQTPSRNNEGVFDQNVSILFKIKDGKLIELMR